LERSLQKLLLSFSFKLPEHKVAAVLNDELQHMNNATMTFVLQRWLTFVSPNKGTLIIGMYAALIMEDGIVYPLARL
jgi:hypothetical protein